MSFDHLLYTGRAEQILHQIVPGSVLACVTDPPYGLTQYRLDQVRACLQAWLAGKPYCPTGKGFMGRRWDNWIPGPEVWAPVSTTLTPGGYTLAFSSTRTVDLLALALRLSGFTILDQLVWLRGRSWPKGKHLDGRYCTTLKGLVEPIVLAQKPSGQQAVATLQQYQTGMLNVLDTVIRGEAVKTHSNSAEAVLSKGIYGSGKSGATRQNSRQEQGRFPANVVISHNWDCATVQDGGQVVESRCTAGCPALYLGEAASFFAQFQEEPAAFYADPVGNQERNCGLADRNPGLAVKPVALMKWLLQLVVPLGTGVVLDPFLGSGSTLLAGDDLGIPIWGIDADPVMVATAQQRLTGWRELR